MTMCAHKWNVLDKTILESPWQQLDEAARRGIDVDDSFFTEYYCQQKLVLVMTCDLCGERDTLIECTEVGA